MMICRVRAHRQRQAVAIHNRHDFHAFSTLGRADLRAPALGHREGRVDKAHQQAKNVKELLKEHFAYVITVCDSARERAPIFPFTPNLVHWSIYDPESAQHSTEEKKNVFRRVRDEIRAKVESFLNETTKTNPQLSKTAEAR